MTSPATITQLLFRWRNGVKPLSMNCCRRSIASCDAWPIITCARSALELDPVSLIVNTGYGQRLYNARRYDQAIEQLRKTLELDPTCGVKGDPGRIDQIRVGSGRAAKSSNRRSIS